MRLLLPFGGGTIADADKERRAAMGFYAGLDVSLKRTQICVIDDGGTIVWRGWADTHPEMIAEKLAGLADTYAKVGLETGSLSPWLFHALSARGLPVVVMDARRASDAMKARAVKTDKADALALAEMLRAGWYKAVHVKSEESHRHRALLGARDQLVKNKRMLLGQVRGMLKPFGITFGCRQGRRGLASAHARRRRTMKSCRNA